MTLKRGFEFTHHHFLDPDWRPDIAAGQKYVDAPRARMRITRVTKTSVYYTYLDGRGRHVMDRTKFEAEYAAQVVALPNSSAYRGQ